MRKKPLWGTDHPQVEYIRGEKVYQRFSSRIRCGKKFIYDYASAEDFANKQYFNKGILLATYRCRKCDGWHLTSRIDGTDVKLSN